MLESEKLAIAAHLHVLLRRKLGRVTDVEWMVKNREYAMEVVRVARSEAHTDLHEWADKLEATMLTSRLQQRPNIMPLSTIDAMQLASGPPSDHGPLSVFGPPLPMGMNPANRYVGRLR